MISDVLGGFAAGVWAMRWPIVVALALWGVSSAVSWALEKHRDALRQLKDARDENARLHNQVRLLGGITRGLARTVTEQDSPAPWINGKD